MAFYRELRLSGRFCGVVSGLMQVRDGKAATLSKRLSDLIQVAFGFNRPDAQETPDVPLHVSAILIGLNAAAVKWNAAARAEYYRVFKKVHSVDNDYLAANSPADLDFALENLPANSTIDIVVTAVNNGGESPVSEKITIVVLTDGHRKTAVGRPAPPPFPKENYETIFHILVASAALIIPACTTNQNFASTKVSATSILMKKELQIFQG